MQCLSIKQYRQISTKKHQNITSTSVLITTGIKMLSIVNWIQTIDITKKNF